MPARSPRSVGQAGQIVGRDLGGRVAITPVLFDVADLQAGQGATSGSPALVLAGANPAEGRILQFMQSIKRRLRLELGPAPGAAAVC
jgi:hypothetical protein